MKMVRITCFLRPHKVEEVKTAIANSGVTGVNVADVRGRGVSQEQPARIGDAEILVALPIRAKLVTVVPEELAEEVVEAIIRSARTGEPNDGKIFIEAVSDAIRIRTGERGQMAL